MGDDPMTTTVIRVVQGDLTTQDTDVIVNAANEQLAHGGGVAAAIVRAGGDIVQDESDRWVLEHGPVGAGSAAVTSAGSMPAHHVVHVVGPRYEPDGDNARLLAQAVATALDAATAHGARTVALPAISAGVFGYPLVEATAVIASATMRWVKSHPEALDEVRLVGHDGDVAGAFLAALD
jgi:putative ATPase